jgi:hypothetical protein
MVSSKQPGMRTFEVVDVQNVQADNPQAGVKAFTITGKPTTRRFDIVIAGGGMGGIAAAIRASQMGMKVCITEETDWIGGQMTAQGVSALDENYLVETSGATHLYQEMRRRIRKHYQSLPYATPEAAKNPLLDPGRCWVSRLAFEPEVGLSVLTELIAETTGTNQPVILLRTKAVRSKLVRGRLKNVLCVNLDTGRFIELHARYFIDATELGDLLPLANVPYSSGAESKEETNEAHAPETANPQNVQDFTYPFVVGFTTGLDATIAKPSEYARLRSQDKFSFLGYRMFEKAKVEGRDAQYLPFWTYRRLIDRTLFGEPISSDVSMINWESNDVRGENLIDQTPAKQAERLAFGKLVSLGFLYWLQTEAPRDEGGQGYPEIKLLPEVLGTADGLSKYPYIRESRRIKAARIVFEQDIAAATNSGARARFFPDSVGIGLYPIDIHGHQDVPGAGQAAAPFQIPLGALVQPYVRNLIPACKNIGTTHITNGAYRLHPVEWAIGEAEGTLAAICISTNRSPMRVWLNEGKRQAVQKHLADNRAPLFWYDDIPTEHPQFSAIQFLSALGVFEASDEHLHFEPDKSVAPDDAAKISSLARTRMNKSARDRVQPTTLAPMTRAQFAAALYANFQRTTSSADSAKTHLIPHLT